MLKKDISQSSGSNTKDFGNLTTLKGLSIAHECKRRACIACRNLSDDFKFLFQFDPFYEADPLCGTNDKVVARCLAN